MKEGQQLVFVSFDNAGAPVYATLFIGEVTSTDGPDGGRMVARGYTANGEPIMRWADRGNVFPVFNEELPEELAIPRPLTRRFGGIETKFIVERTPKGYSITSIRNGEPPHPTQ